MNKTHEFYPMITGTVRTIMSLANEQDKKQILFILQYYPLQGKIPEKEISYYSGAPKELLKELDRQFLRWNKGGIQ